ncbi:hypothetical protein [Chroococcidiopsis sp. SAG 2025]|nr:hypothetical protein [Chroococcidiopsis sp. SAG 2025]
MNLMQITLTAHRTSTHTTKEREIAIPRPFAKWQIRNLETTGLKLQA